MLHKYIEKEYFTVPEWRIFMCYRLYYDNPKIYNSIFINHTLFLWTKNRKV